MSEYKRLTNKDWKENYDMFEDVDCDTYTDDCEKCNNMDKEEISWVVGEAIQFAYEVGYLDCELKRGYSKFDKIVEKVLEYLDNDSERNTLKKILNMEV